MADGSKIEWTDATWNIITGCSVVSPGCTNCYAMKLAGTRLRNHPSRAELTDDSKAGPVWNGQVRFNEQWLDQPLRWSRPRMIFVCAHGDLFHEAVPEKWIDQVFAVMALAPQHIFQVLTKRPERMRDYCLRLENEPHRQTVKRFCDAIPWDSKPKLPPEITIPFPHVWLGFSAEDQERFDERWPHMEKLAWAGWLTWLSAEPLLGPIDATAALWSFRPCGDCPSPDPEKGISEDCCRDPELVDGLKWIVAGGESGAGARPAHPDWFRQIRDDSQRAEVAFHFKQWGDWLPGENHGAPPGQPWPDAEWQDGETGRHSRARDHGGPEWRHFTRPGDPGAFALRVGKKAAGRELDGRTWDEMPAAVQALEAAS